MSRRAMPLSRYGGLPWRYGVLLAATGLLLLTYRRVSVALPLPPPRHPSGHCGECGECGDDGTGPLRWQVKAGNSAAHRGRAGYLRPCVDARVDARTTVVGAEWTRSEL